MKYIRIVLFSLCVFGVTFGYVHSCTSKVTSFEEPQIITVVDTAKINELRDSINILQDSLLVYKNDTVIEAELFILRYKLERIKYYNDIAANGNNIKYLRGWINRVINE